MYGTAKKNYDRLFASNWHKLVIGDVARSMRSDFVDRK
jgi:hypothetical protein